MWGNGPAAEVDGRMSLMRPRTVPDGIAFALIAGAGVYWASLFVFAGKRRHR